VLFCLIAEPCTPTNSSDFYVTDRTSDMFIANLTYNCSFINSSLLTVFHDGQEHNCNATEYFQDATDDSTVILICRDIKRHAGRNWSFDLSRTLLDDKSTINETFTITLEPQPLPTSTEINVAVDENLTSASIFIPDCEEIAAPADLKVRCNISDTLAVSLSTNCTHICNDLKPGSDNIALLIRSPIKIADNGSIFPEVNQSITYQIGKIKMVVQLSSNLLISSHFRS
jgi:hypothetical protein